MVCFILSLINLHFQVTILTLCLFRFILVNRKTQQDFSCFELIIN